MQEAPQHGPHHEPQPRGGGHPSEIDGPFGPGHAVRDVRFHAVAGVADQTRDDAAQEQDLRGAHIYYIGAKLRYPC